MISGLTGQEMPCDIFVGLVYYQRLRHMVSDKFQVWGVWGGPPAGEADGRRRSGRVQVSGESGEEEEEEEWQGAGVWGRHLGVREGGWVPGRAHRRHNVG